MTKHVENYMSVVSKSMVIYILFQKYVTVVFKMSCFNLCNIQVKFKQKRPGGGSKGKFNLSQKNNFCLHIVICTLLFFKNIIVGPMRHSRVHYRV